MEDTFDFKCISDNLEAIPPAITEKTGLSFPAIHTKGEYMAVIARAMKEYRGDVFCRLPFCNTVEAEAFGGLIKLGDEKTGPRVKDFRYQSIEELAAADLFDLQHGRISEVLKALSLLTAAGEQVVLNIEGPFTIISSLMDLTKFYKALRKNPAAVTKVLQKIDAGLTAYAAEAVERGAVIISYADQVGTKKLVGPKVFADVSAPVTVRLLRTFQAVAKGRCAVHLCGLLSADLENMGLCTSVKKDCPPQGTYGEALLQCIKDQTEGVLIGHACIKKTGEPPRNHALYQLILS